MAAQTYPHIEHIVIDAASTDGTVDIIRKNSGRIGHWISEPDKGLGDAWNKGIRVAKGEIIGMLNADDQYEKRAVEKAVAALKPGDAALTYGDAALFSEDIAKPDFMLKGGFDPVSIYHGFGFMHTTCFATSRVYREVGGFDLRYKIAVDSDFLLRCLLRKIEFRKTDMLTFMRMGGMSEAQFHKAYKEYLTQLYRLGFSKPRIARAWLSHMRLMTKRKFVSISGGENPSLYAPWPNQGL